MMPNLSDDQLLELYETALGEVSVESVEATGRQWEQSASKLRILLQETYRAMKAANGISPRDFGHLLVLNGITLIALSNYKEQNQ